MVDQDVMGTILQLSFVGGIGIGIWRRALKRGIAAGLAQVPVPPPAQPVFEIVHYALPEDAPGVIASDAFSPERQVVYDALIGMGFPEDITRRAVVKAGGTTAKDIREQALRSMIQ